MKNLKLLPLLICSLFLLFSCSNNNEKNNLEDMKLASESFLKKQLKDPSSYQNISIEVIDSVSKLESIEEDFDLFYDKTMLEIGSATKAERDSVLNVIKQLKSNPKLDSLSYVSIAIKYRAKNSFGALDLGESVVYYFVKPQPKGNCCMIYSNSNKNQ